MGNMVELTDDEFEVILRIRRVAEEKRKALEYKLHLLVTARDFAQFLQITGTSMSYEAFCNADFGYRPVDRENVKLTYERIKQLIDEASSLSGTCDD
jgi:hypothetical protein